MYRAAVMNQKHTCHCHDNEPRNDQLKVACLCLDCPKCNPTRYRNRAMNASGKNPENVQQ